MSGASKCTWIRVACHSSGFSKSGHATSKVMPGFHQIPPAPSKTVAKSGRAGSSVLLPLAAQCLGRRTCTSPTHHLYCCPVHRSSASHHSLAENPASCMRRLHSAIQQAAGWERALAKAACCPAWQPAPCCALKIRWQPLPAAPLLQQRDTFTSGAAPCPTPPARSPACAALD